MPAAAQVVKAITGYPYSYHRTFHQLLVAVAVAAVMVAMEQPLSYRQTYQHLYYWLLVTVEQLAMTA